MSRLDERVALEVQLLCGCAVIGTRTGLISDNQFTNLHSCLWRKKGQTGLGRTNPAETIKPVPHSSLSKRERDVSFPFSRGLCSIRSRKRLSRNEVRRIPGPVMRGANGIIWSVLSALVLLAKTVREPNLHLWATWMTHKSADTLNVDLWRQVHFLRHFSFSCPGDCTYRKSKVSVTHWAGLFTWTILL